VPTQVAVHGPEEHPARLERQALGCHVPGAIDGVRQMTTELLIECLAHQVQQARHNHYVEMPCSGSTRPQSAHR
jgi:hypothetical protein